MLSARTGSISPSVPGLTPSSPSMTLRWMYDELLSLTSEGSARTMSPGRPTTSLPPSLIAELGDGAADAGADAGACVAAGADGLAAGEHAASTIAAAATSAPMR